MARTYPHQKRTARLAEIRARTLAAFRHLDELDAATRKVLTREGVCSIEYCRYHTFARQVSKAQRHHGGDALVREEQELFEKAKRRGCEEATLRRILAEVFGAGVR